MSYWDEIHTCPVCGNEFKRADMTWTNDYHGIRFRLVCFDCYDKIYEEADYDGQCYDERDECLDYDY